MICQKMLIVLCGLPYVTERGADEMEFKSLEVHSSRKGLNVFPSRKWIKCSQVVKTSSTFSATEESLIEGTAITNLHPARHHAQIVYGPSGTYGSRNRCGSFRTAPGSLARRQIIADFLHRIAKQRIPPEKPSKATTGVVFSFHIS